MRNWDREAVLPESIEMKLDRFVDQAGHLRPRIGGGDAAGQVRHIGPETLLCLFNHDQISHEPCSSGLSAVGNDCFNPLCCNTLLSVPGGTSADDLPATVTVPGFVGWWNCR